MAQKKRGNAKLGERRAIRTLERLLGPSVGGRAGAVEVGIGDDAAVVRFGGQRWVLTVDVCIENVHFKRAWLSFQDVGWRAFHAAASDLAAMGACPAVALSSLVLPAGFSRAELGALGEGQADASEAVGCPIVGGNIAKGPALVVDTTVIGTLGSSRPLLRSGARPGEELWLIGPTGLARAGYQLLSERRRVARTDERACIAAWRRPTARIERGLALVGRASSAIDLSDGLCGDAQRLAEASVVDVVIEAKRLQRALPAELRTVCERRGWDALQMALLGGEDYALLGTGPKARRPRWARAIGRVVAGEGTAWLERDGQHERLSDSFEHQW